MKDKFNFEIEHKIEDYNSNNSWGFGGSRGLKYIFNEDLYMIIGFAGTRHMGEFPHITIRYNGEIIMNLSGHNSLNIKKAKNKIHELVQSS